MKRAVALIFIAAATITGFLSIRGAMPFMPVFGTSMEPVLHAGNLIVIKEAFSSEIKIGDIIVYSVPAAIREHYNYPPIVAHRVIKEVELPGSGKVWRTKGDNTGEDPFSIRPQDLKGKVSFQIPYLGFPLLFFQSKQGTIFIIIGLALLAIYLYMDEITMGRRKVQAGLFSPVLRDNARRSRMLEHRTGSLEKGMEGTQRALESFAAAVAEYGEHLKSHTSAIQGLSEASQELRKSTAEQNKVLLRLSEIVELGAAGAVRRTPEPRIEAEPAIVVESPAAYEKDEAPAIAPEPPKPEAAPKTPPAQPRQIVFKLQKGAVPGCWKSRKTDGKA